MRPRRARITGWCGSTSPQTELDAHRTVIRKPALLRILVVEHHAHERIADHALRQIAPEQDIVDVFAVFAVGGAGRELRLSRDVRESGGGWIPIVDLGEEAHELAVGVPRRTLLER